MRGASLKDLSNGSLQFLFIDTNITQLRIFVVLLQEKRNAIDKKDVLAMQLLDLEKGQSKQSSISHICVDYPSAHSSPPNVVFITHQNLSLHFP